MILIHRFYSFDRLLALLLLPIPCSVLGALPFLEFCLSHLVGCVLFLVRLHDGLDEHISFEVIALQHFPALLEVHRAEVVVIQINML